ncbi:MAG: deaminase [Streptosporangiales bacterium]|nr:deaminase [Streptosporangiales bacterium]
MRPYVLLSVATSVDGHVDDASDARLVLSNEADLDRVDEVRAGCDAILVGASTVRRDDPRLVVRAERLRADRVARGRPADPLKVTITTSGELDPAARFFRTGESGRLVYCADATAGALGSRLGGLADVVAGGPGAVDLPWLLADLHGRGVRKLLVEGGPAVAGAFLAAGLVDELHLVIAPFFVGDPAAPRFTVPGSTPYGPARPMTLAEVRRLDGVVLLRYVFGG